MMSYSGLQQLLPFTVLKRIVKYSGRKPTAIVATALTVYGIETVNIGEEDISNESCNSSYRLRY